MNTNVESCLKYFDFFSKIRNLSVILVFDTPTQLNFLNLEWEDEVKKF